MLQPAQPPDLRGDILKALAAAGFSPTAESAQDFYPVNVFCQRNGISRRTFYELVKDKKLVARKVRGKTGVTREDAAAWRASLPKLETAAAA
jgi:predicted DNA-binding transcriptional regulator AlpA